MQYTLSNDNFEVIVDSKGCEIVSVIRKSDNKQYIWSGQPDIWKRHTPVLSRWLEGIRTIPQYTREKNII